jgi:hypothetical protein
LETNEYHNLYAHLNPFLCIPTRKPFVALLKFYQEEGEGGGEGRRGNLTDFTTPTPHKRQRFRRTDFSEGMGRECGWGLNHTFRHPVPKPPGRRPDRFLSFFCFLIFVRPKLNSSLVLHAPHRHLGLRCAALLLLVSRGIHLCVCCVTVLRFNLGVRVGSLCRA